MKKVIALSLLLVSGLADAGVIKGPKFSNWETAHSDEGSWISSQVRNKVLSTTLYMNADGSVDLSILPNDSGSEGLGEVTNLWKVVVDVNGQAVIFIGKRYSSGYMIYSPKTHQGDAFVRQQMLNKKTVMFTMDDGWWASFNTVGVTKAWSYLKSNSAI